MALGPLLALPLSRLPRTSFRLLGRTWGPLTDITVAGYVMAAVWLAFITAVLLLFKDPLAGPQAALVHRFRRRSAAATTRAAAAAAATDASQSAEEETLDRGGFMSSQPGHAAREAMVPLLNGSTELLDAEAAPPTEAAAADPAGTTNSERSQRRQQQLMQQQSEHHTPYPELRRPSAASAAAPPSLSPSWLPTLTCLGMLFSLKLLQQGTISAVPIFTEVLLGWSKSQVRVSASDC